MPVKTPLRRSELLTPPDAGIIELRVLIEDDGRVSDYLVTSIGRPELVDQIARHMQSHWRFAPAPKVPQPNRSNKVASCASASRPKGPRESKFFRDDRSRIRPHLPRGPDRFTSCP